MIAIFGLRGETVANLIDVFGDLRIFHYPSAVPNTAHDSPPDLSFCRLAQNRISRAAHVGQLNVIGAGAGDKNDACHREEQQGAFKESDDQKQILKWLVL